MADTVDRFGRTERSRGFGPALLLWREETSEIESADACLYKRDMSKVHKLLVLEDSELDYVLLNRTLEKFFGSLGVKLLIARGYDKNTFESKFLGEEWDCVVTDFNIPGYSALEAIDLVHKRTAAACPVIVYSGAIGEEMTVEVIKRGASDLILKSDLSRLGPSILQSLRENESHIKEAEAQKAATAASTSRERFLEIVSHDIKTPLTSIQLITETLLHDPRVVPEINGQLGKILKNLSRIERIVSDVLNQAKLDSGTLHPSTRSIEVGSFLRGLAEEFEELAKAKEISIVTDCAKEIYLDADSTLLFQAISNLMGNALKFSPRGKRIFLEARRVENFIRIVVRDEGAGIPAEKLPFIFEKFYRASSDSQAGFGLGLFICREIVAAHGGKISVESLPGQGATFTMEIPASRKINVPARKDKRPSEKPRTILLVEDDIDLNEVLAEVLEREGYKVLTCESVRDARQLLAGAHDQISLVITDFRLGDGTAYDVLAALDEVPETHSVKRILLSADWTLPDLNRIPQVDKILKKPINTEDLLFEVERLSRGARKQIS